MSLGDEMQKTGSEMLKNNEFLLGATQNQEQLSSTMDLVFRLRMVMWA